LTLHVAGAALAEHEAVQRVAPLVRGDDEVAALLRADQVLEELEDAEHALAAEPAGGDRRADRVAGRREQPARRERDPEAAAAGAALHLGVDVRGPDRLHALLAGEVAGRGDLE